jgi:hypothetical protein
MQLKKIFDSNITIDQILIELIIPSHDNYIEILDNYRHLFNINEIKITILESKITDNILALSNFSNINLLERITDDPPESYFIYYINNILKDTNRFFFIYADEFITLDQIKILFYNNSNLIYLNRFECFYNLNSNLFSKQLRGGSYQTILEIIDSFGFKKSFHDFWNYNNSSKYSDVQLDVLHLHKYDVLRDYGKSSKYVFEEIKMLKKYNYFKLYFLKRFFFRLLSRLLNIKLLLNNYKIYLYLLFAQIIESSNAVLFILENKLKNKK